MDAKQQKDHDFITKLREFWEDNMDPELYSPEGKFFDFTGQDVINGLARFCVIVMVSRSNYKEMIIEFHNSYSGIASNVLEEIQNAEDEGREPFSECM